MKISNFLYNGDHARRYATGCLVKLNEKIVYIERVVRTRNGDYLFYYRNLPLADRDDNVSYFSHKDTSVDWNPGRLGFININDRINKNIPLALYIYRLNRRSYRLGLSTHSIGIDFRTCNLNTEYRIDHLLYSELAAESLNNSYPSIDQALYSLNVSHSIALSRSLAIVMNRDIYFCRNRQEPIGKFDIKTKTIRLNEKYFYLQQVIQEGGFKCEF